MTQYRTPIPWSVARRGAGTDVPGGDPVAAPAAVGAPNFTQDGQRPAPRSLGQRVADLWLAGLFAVSGRCPSLLRAAAGPFCWGTWRFSKSVRSATLANAARILGPASTPADRARLARGVVRSFYLFCLDVGRSAGMTRDQLLADNDAVEGFENYETAKAAGKGLIVVTAHMGSFEVGLAQLSLREPRVHVIFRRDAQGGFERQRSELRHRLDVIEHPVDDGWQMWIGLRDALLAGDAVVFQGDRVMPGQRGKRVPFLHGTLEMPTGPVKMSRLTGAPILPVFTARNPDGRIKVMIDPPVTTADDRPTTDGSDPMLAKLAATIERRVAEFPDQWLMFHRAFCEDREVGRVVTAEAQRTRSSD